MHHDTQRDKELELLRTLSEAFGVSGFEREIRGRIRELVTPLVDEVHTDPLGNLHGVLNPAAPFTLMLDAHMDEIGFMVRGLEENGFLRLAPIGGWDVRIVPGQAVVVRSRSGAEYWGVVGSVPPHVQEPDERKRVFDWKDLFVDIGAGSPTDLEELGIRVGSPAILPQPLRVLGEQTVLGKALDDRAGCAVVVHVLEALAAERLEDVQVVATFSTSEEVGCRGARVAARRWRPHMALILEGTLATDTPGVRPDQRVAALGKGPVLTAADRSVIVPEALLEEMIRLAEEEGIPWQMKTPMVGSTDAGAIQVSEQGVLTAIVSVPCRYIHSPGCLMRLDDLRHTEHLVEVVLRRAREIYARVQDDEYSGP
jgi:putative aminopeptidase FrvX